jgi:hypothetical protein
MHVSNPPPLRSGPIVSLLVLYMCMSCASCACSRTTCCRGLTTTLRCHAHNNMRTSLEKNPATFLLSTGIVVLRRSTRRRRARATPTRVYVHKMRWQREILLERPIAANSSLAYNSIIQLYSLVFIYIRTSPLLHNVLHLFPYIHGIVLIYRKSFFSIFH